MSYTEEQWKEEKFYRYLGRCTIILFLIGCLISCSVGGAIGFKVAKHQHHTTNQITHVENKP